MSNIKEKFNMFAFGRVAWNLALVALLVIWIVSIQRTSNMTIQGVDIDINSVEGVKDMIVDKEILDVMKTASTMDLSIVPIKKLDIQQIESALKSDSRIYNADVYIDAQQKLRADIVQRRPILRIKSASDQDYYLDQGGVYVNKTQYRAVRVPVVTGYIEPYQPDWNRTKNSRIKKAYDIGMVISQDEFLSSLIEQIHFERTGRIVLIPKVGEHKIVLDYMDDLERKLTYNLKRFYKNMAKENSWDQYDELDISYRKQVVGRNLANP